MALSKSLASSAARRFRWNRSHRLSSLAPPRSTLTNWGRRKQMSAIGSYSGRCSTGLRWGCIGVISNGPVSRPCVTVANSVIAKNTGIRSRRNLLPNRIGGVRLQTPSWSGAPRMGLPYTCIPWPGAAAPTIPVGCTSWRHIPNGPCWIPWKTFPYLKARSRVLRAMSPFPLRSWHDCFPGTERLLETPLMPMCVT